MKQIYYSVTVLFAVLLCTAAHGQVNKKVSVLFLGNSYTYVNNLPLLVYNIAKENGDTLVYDSNCPGGYTFFAHSNDATSKAKIGAKPWDFVVLQGQSQEPSFSPAQVNSQSLPYVLRLDSLIKKNNGCTSTVFYETWGYKNGDASNCTAYPPVCTYTGMQARLKQSYKKFADTTLGIMAPVGEAFRRSVGMFPGLELYQADQSHPSPEGSFLAAAVFYEVLFRKSVIGNTYNPGIATNSLSFLQFTAHKVVSDSLKLWNIESRLPWAGFTYTVTNPLTYQFGAASQGLTHSWYFGDGGNSSQVNPAHTYQNSGSYTVSHVVSNLCKRDSFVTAVNIQIAGISESAGREMGVYPNPCTSQLAVHAPAFENSEARVQIISGTGQVVYEDAYSPVVYTRGLPNGLYLLRIRNKFTQANTCFIKNE